MNPDLNPKTKLEFEASSGIILTELKFNKLRGLARNSVVQYLKMDNNDKKTDSVRNFCMRIRKGSKKYRKIITGKESSVISTNILRYADILDQVIDLESSVRLNNQWGYNFLDNSTRTFIFKLHNNLLGTNARVAHFVRDHPRSCTFCSLRQAPEENPETIVHLFFECENIVPVLGNFYGWLFNQNEQMDLSARDFFQGFNFACPNKTFVLDLCSIIVKKFLWDCKLRFYIPSFESMKTYFTTEICNLYKNIKRVREAIIKSRFFVDHNGLRF